MHSWLNMRKSLFSTSYLTMGVIYATCSGNKMHCYSEKGFTLVLRHKLL